MNYINIGTFSLEIYDENNRSHKRKAELFEDDDSFSMYVGDFWALSSSVNYAKNKGRYSEIYLAYMGEELVGMIGLIWIFDYPELVVGILPNKRGNHYSSLLIREYTKYVFDSYQEYQALYANIYSENIHSIENVEMAGFKRLDNNMFIKKR